MPALKLETHTAQTLESFQQDITGIKEILQLGTKILERGDLYKVCKINITLKPSIITALLLLVHLCDCQTGIKNQNNILVLQPEFRTGQELQQFTELLTEDNIIKLYNSITELTIQWK